VAETTRRAESVGRTDLQAAIDPRAVSPRPASDLGQRRPATGVDRDEGHELAARAPERIDTDVLAARSADERDQASARRRVLRWATADVRRGMPGRHWPDSLAQGCGGDDVNSLSTRNINFTTICYTGAGSARSTREGRRRRYALSTAEVGRTRVGGACRGATRVVQQAAIDPELR